MGPVVLAEVIQASVGLLSEPLRLGAIEVSVNLEDPAAEAWGNTLQLEQVLVNLLTNAKDAVARTAVKRITITVHPDHEWQVITVTDTGQGMTDDTLLHIFDPFYTTKEVGVGTGLGLSIVYGIIKDHGGHISAQSRPGDGASFEIRLPRNAPTEDSATAPLAMRQG
jgi:C4-dicarboxylate-specific signal transduction histidine kinase